MLRAHATNITYKYLKCGSCNWRICDAPTMLQFEILPYMQNQSIKNTHLILKCKRCKTKNIIVIN